MGLGYRFVGNPVNGKAVLVKSGLTKVGGSTEISGLGEGSRPCW